jgi:hypothetical protein
MAPYVKFIVGDHSEKTGHLKKRTTDFIWEDDAVVDFHVQGYELITIEVYHNKTLLKDKLIGSANFNLVYFLAKNATMESIPLVFEGYDAGTLLLEIFYTPDNLSLNNSNGIAPATITNNLLMQPNFGAGQQTGQQTVHMEDNSLLTKPIVTSEVTVIKHDAIITREAPIIYEKNIIHERPIITERTIIHSEQPIIIERPELHERIINEELAPIVRIEDTIFRQETGLLSDQNLQGAEFHTENQYVKDQAQFFRDTPVIHQKDVILEKPIIHEKDIIYRERPVIVEKPEVVEKHIYETHAPVIQTDASIFQSSKEFTSSRPLVGDNAIVVQDEAIITVAEPMYRKELPDIHETNMIIEKPMIHEQTIVHSERQTTHERPEVHEKVIFHQDQTLLQKQNPLFFQTGVNQPLI